MSKIDSQVRDQPCRSAHVGAELARLASAHHTPGAFRHPHPIAKYRVNGPLSNLPTFRDAFQCKADAPLVRQGKQRCEVW